MRVAAFQSKCFPAYRLALYEGATAITDKLGELTGNCVRLAPRYFPKRQIRPGNGNMPKIIWSCSDCGTVLPLWQIKCTNCHRLALSWLHLILASGTALSAVVLLLKIL